MLLCIFMTEYSPLFVEHFVHLKHGERDVRLFLKKQIDFVFVELLITTYCLWFCTTFEK